MKSKNETYDFEEWESDAYFFDKEDWAGLLNLRKARAKKRPSDLYAQAAYAEALNLNRKYKETIDFLNPLYLENYEFGFGITEILDALYGLGKTEDDFTWLEKPVVLKLDKNKLDLCEKFLKGKRKHVSFLRIYENLIMQADYLTFNEQELSDYLKKHTEIFDFTGDKSDFLDIEIKLNKR